MRSAAVLWRDSQKRGDRTQQVGDNRTINRHHVAAIGELFELRENGLSVRHKQQG